MLKAFFELKEEKRTNKNKNTTSDIHNITLETTKKSSYQHIETVNKDTGKSFENKQTLPRNNISKPRQPLNEFSKQAGSLFRQLSKKQLH